VVATSGCSVYGQTGPTVQAAPVPASSGPARLASLSDIPVGGGVILAEQGVVLTRVQGGEVRAFSTVCTHAGCTVAEVGDGLIRCPCHGSAFSIADGSVRAGPAPAPLPPVAVVVSGTDVVRT
jgi:Rieske Fe-S protein